MEPEQSDYNNQNGKKALFLDPKEYEESNAMIKNELEFDIGDTTIEEILKGDTSPLLVVWRSYLTPKTVDDYWLQNNIF